ncbi:MAG: conjugal transfer protein [Firmicutes bacterium]|nr:conjugal transfer protein [Bacillota bacterium]
MRWKSAGRGFLRWTLWIVLGWVFVRGILSFLPQTPARAAEPGVDAKPAVEPAGLRAAPEMFAREYLTWTAGGADERAARLQPFLARSLDRQAGWAPGADDAGQQVEQTWVYAVRPASPTRWLVTVAARVVPFQNNVTVTKDKDGKETRKTEAKALPARTVFLAVPVSKAGSGWVVYDYPSLLPAPEAAAFAEPAYYGQETSDAGGRAQSLLTDFFKAYLSGGDVTYYLTPETKLNPIKAGWSFQQVSGLKLVKTNDGTWAMAEVAVQDPASGARYTYRYTVKLAERDGRWYVADMLQKGE